LTERFLQAGIKAAALHYHKADETRDEIVKQFKARQIQVLVNVSIASYGFDGPSIDCIVLARPTKSVVLWLQMLGRGMRTFNGKEFCMVIDHTNGVRNRELGFADDLRRWRLDKGKKASTNWTRDERNKDRQEGEDKTYQCKKCEHLFSRSRVCPKCGTEIPMPKRDIAAVKADLERLSRKLGKGQREEFPPDEIFYRMLMGHAIRNGYKIGFAYHKFREKYDREPDPTWKHLEPLPPSRRVSTWLKHKRIQWIKSRKPDPPGART
jgi:superfamily II DNA or RNA helicase